MLLRKGHPLVGVWIETFLRFTYQPNQRSPPRGGVD